MVKLSARRGCPIAGAAVLGCLGWWLVGFSSPALVGADLTDDRAVALPPFMVEEMAKGPPWRYAEAVGYEILSRCDDAVTRRVVEAHHRMHGLLAEMLPGPLRFSVAAPRSLILYDEQLQPASSQEVIAQVMRSDRGVEASNDVPALGLGRGMRMPLAVPRFSFLPNLRLWDRDAMAVFMIVRRDDFDADRLSLTQDYVTFLVKNRLPALPPWFVSGILKLFSQTAFARDRLTLAPLEWISEVHSAAVKINPAAAPAVRPLGEFLLNKLSPPVELPSFEPIQAWQAQAALFVRWGLDADKGAHREALWKFVELSATVGATEKNFVDCFGFGYEDALARLVVYRSAAVNRAISFKPKGAPKNPPLVLRNASDGEIARIKGDWERMEVPYVKAISPDLAPKYLAQARKTLRRAYDRDNRDPRLLAVMGLCENDAGNEVGAREFLEAAVRLGPVRPRANYELARLRFQEMRAHPAESAGRLSLPQMVEVLTPLFAARATLPPLPEVYELIGEVWGHGISPPTRGHLTVLDEGVRLFPRRTALVLLAAELYLRSGFREEASVFADIATRSASDAPALARVAALTRALAENPTPP